MYEAGQQWEAIPFYQCVVENEIKQHSERFAVSHYKWFRAEIDRGLDMERYKEAVIRFRPYTKRLLCLQQQKRSKKERVGPPKIIQQIGIWLSIMGTFYDFCGC